jgi:hypothetical protein
MSVSLLESKFTNYIKTLQVVDQGLTSKIARSSLIGELKP